MTFSLLTLTPQRGNGFREKPRTSPLPSYSSAIHEKHQLTTRPTSYFATLLLPIPGVHGRQLKIPLPIPSRIYHSTRARFGRKRGCLVLTLGAVIVLWTLFALTRRFGSGDKQWPTPFQGEPSTLVYGRRELQKIWDWEIASGHYPSSREIPEQIGLKVEPLNPGLPRATAKRPLRYRPPPKPAVSSTKGAGAKRVYLDIQSSPPNVAYPPRPIPGSIADLDVVMDHCDFSKNKYVRDCLEVLRMGGGLDNENRMRRAKADHWRYIYLEDEPTNSTESLEESKPDPYTVTRRPGEESEDPNLGLSKKRGAEWEAALELPRPWTYHTAKSHSEPCDPDYPRLYHMFWTGPFTDKPYLALLSYLYTQNLGLQSPPDYEQRTVCRPQFWLWINPGPAAAVPNPSARKDMFNHLKSNPWAAPFLHPRFKDVIQFKLWNTTEQLDGVPELKDEWRELQEALFNSGGHIIQVPQKKEEPITSSVDDAGINSLANVTIAGDDTKTGASKPEEEDLVNRLGSKSSSSYDRLSVILSDMARFVLCHRFGGTYLDADTILLRDWEELWGWKGAFAYRWSRLEKYNTAVLRMNKNSALGTFLFRTALKNGLDFHPMTVSRYTKDAYLEGLLLRLPDALFDSAWLNTEYYQRDRPPQPYFQAFDDFFDTPAANSAAPQALGINGFFRGAYSYHFHNFWWKPFDPSRNFPDLGPRFIKGEQQARAALAQSTSSTSKSTGVDPPEAGKDETVDDEKRDLDWASVLKRTFEAYIRGERPNMYGEWIHWV
ncbi:hypothetical protein BD410DRAFT_781248 [Rickenella mellea]|uniref:Glycosyltransferase family 32 protein n=1 Tax=Rickenella mellea TaxID=50990 RepID=A0A4Y7QM32_9AGAM|nr:hypothetical protein BD410DRAFT_781248 [Rickenella mellea]